VWSRDRTRDHTPLRDGCRDQAGVGLAAPVRPVLAGRVVGAITGRPAISTS
jgi:hypothetical protein